MNTDSRNKMTSKLVYTTTMAQETEFPYDMRIFNISDLQWKTWRVLA